MSDNITNLLVGFIQQPFSSYNAVLPGSLARIKDSTKSVMSIQWYEHTVCIQGCYVEGVDFAWYTSSTDAEAMLHRLLSGRTIFKMEFTLADEVRVLETMLNFKLPSNIQTREKLSVLIIACVFKHIYSDWDFALPFHAQNVAKLNDILSNMVTSAPSSTKEYQISTIRDQVAFFAYLTGCERIIEFARGSFQVQSYFTNCRHSRGTMQTHMVAVGKTQGSKSVYAKMSITDIVSTVKQIAQIRMMHDKNIAGIRFWTHEAAYLNEWTHGTTSIKLSSNSPLHVKRIFNMHIPSDNLIPKGSDHDQEYALSIFEKCIKPIVNFYGALRLGSNSWIVRLLPEDTKHLYTGNYFNDPFTSCDEGPFTNHRLLEWAAEQGNLGESWTRLKKCLIDAMVNILKQVIRVNRHDCLSVISWSDVNTVQSLPFVDGTVVLGASALVLSSTQNRCVHGGVNIVPISMETMFYSPCVKLARVLQLAQNEYPPSLLNGMINNVLQGFIELYAADINAFILKFGDRVVNYETEHWDYLSSVSKSIVIEAVMLHVAQFVVPNTKRTYVSVVFGDSETGKSTFISDIVFPVLGPNMGCTAVRHSTAFSAAENFIIPSDKRCTFTRVVSLTVYDETTRNLSSSERMVLLRLSNGGSFTGSVKYGGPVGINVTNQTTLSKHNTSSQGGGMVYCVNSTCHLVPSDPSITAVMQDAILRRLAGMVFLKRVHVLDDFSSGGFNERVAECRIKTWAMFTKFKLSGRKYDEFCDQTHTTWRNFMINVVERSAACVHQFSTFVLAVTVINTNKACDIDLNYLVEMYLRCTASGYNTNALLLKQANDDTAAYSALVNRFRKTVVSECSGELKWDNVVIARDVCSVCSVHGQAYRSINGVCIKCKGGEADRRDVLIGHKFWLPDKLHSCGITSFKTNVEDMSPSRSFSSNNGDDHHAHLNDDESVQSYSNPVTPVVQPTTSNGATCSSPTSDDSDGVSDAQLLAVDEFVDACNDDDDNDDEDDDSDDALDDMDGFLVDSNCDSDDGSESDHAVGVRLGVQVVDSDSETDTGSNVRVHSTVSTEPTGVDAPSNNVHIQCENSSQKRPPAVADIGHSTKKMRKLTVADSSDEDSHVGCTDDMDAACNGATTAITSDDERAMQLAMPLFD